MHKDTISDIIIYRDLISSTASSWAFLAIALVTLQEGKLPGITSSNFSVLTKVIGLEATLGSVTTFPSYKDGITASKSKDGVPPVSLNILMGT